MAYMAESDWQTIVHDLTAERDTLAAEVRRLQERRETAAQFVEACQRRGSIKSATGYALLGYLRDAPPRATGGDA